MAKNQSAIVNWSQYLSLRALSGFMHCFDVQQNLSTAASVGSLYYRLSKRHRERAENNIALSFPDWSHQQVQDIAHRSIQSMFQLILVDALVTPRCITQSSWPSYIRIGDMPRTVERLIRKQPAIFITGHCGNWELLGYCLAVFGYPLNALARPLDNPLLNRWVMGIRQERGMRIITKWGAAPILQKMLEDGEWIGFIADQNAGDQGLFVPFFGRMASSYKSIGLLAMRYNIPIVAGVAHRINGRFEYELSCTDYITPEDWQNQPDPLFYITTRYNRAMEQMILKAPEQYLWVHRRWKSRPRYERQGKPMPKRMIDKLRSLPWMTPSELDLIVDRSCPVESK
ncbi:MAG: lysophospholipid acyltransferase family protein [Planctomycetes bacterium]|nr:lysophospholipid acyltransferase family protein [Planctomycetota bacterium]